MSARVPALRFLADAFFFQQDVTVIEMSASDTADLESAVWRVRSLRQWLDTITLMLLPSTLTDALGHAENRSVSG
jgi:hypothetical protein